MPLPEDPRRKGGDEGELADGAVPGDVAGEDDDDPGLPPAGEDPMDGPAPTG